MGLEAEDYEVPICVEFRQAEEITKLNKQVQALTQQNELLSEGMLTRVSMHIVDKLRAESDILKAEVEKLKQPCNPDKCVFYADHNALKMKVREIIEQNCRNYETQTNCRKCGENCMSLDTVTRLR